jgi:hypothetical protein
MNAALEYEERSSFINTPGKKFPTFHAFLVRPPVRHASQTVPRKLGGRWAALARPSTSYADVCGLSHDATRTNQDGLVRKGEQLARQTAYKTDVMIVFLSHHVSSSTPWSLTPFAAALHQLDRGRRFSWCKGRDHRSKVSWVGLGHSQVASLSHAAQELAVNDPRQPQLTQLVGYAYVRAQPPLTLTLQGAVRPWFVLPLAKLNDRLSPPI